ncbi:MAG: HupE/UreJ family protein [Alphaproteobacteria bacterium]|nr:HupE/UreJ family protein [Alphaproteobacteria bacterium]
MPTRSSRFSLLAFTILFILASKFAEAHIGTGTAHGGGFMAGFTHPLTGIDHLLAMLSVGIWSAQTGGKTFWLAPLSFVVMMIVGGILGMSGLGPSPFETGIAASVIVLGLAIATAWRPSPLIGGSLCGLFALIHGHAHGTEMALTASPALYSLGFVLATVMLIATGIAMALTMRRFKIENAAAWVGGGVAAVGFALLLM